MKVFYIFPVLICLMHTSCGIYNLEINVRNPLDDVNIYSFGSNDESDSAQEFACRKAIDDEEYEDAITICSALTMNAENAALYASALLAKNGGDLFRLIDAAKDETNQYDSIIEGFTRGLKNTKLTSVDELTAAINLLNAIEIKTENNYFQLAFTYFTLACCYISKSATANGNGTGAITAADIAFMDLTAVDGFYDNLVLANDNLILSGVTGTIAGDLSDMVTFLSDWGTWSEAQKESAIEILFGL